MLARPDLFPGGRPGGLYDVLAARAEDGRLPAPAILELLLEALGPIWADRLVIDGVPLGDCWRHPALRRDDATDGLVPLHKLSQWLSYSLIEPLEEAGIEVTDIDGLTGLAEYRNGGLFVDTGVLALADPGRRRRARTMSPIPLIVAWRAMTVALLDRMAPLVRERLGVDEADFPARPHARRRQLGRRPPHRRRAPPRRRPALQHHQRRNGILAMDGLTIVSHPLVQHKLTILRDRNSSIQLFRTVVREIAALLCYEVTRDLPTELVRDRDPDRRSPRRRRSPARSWSSRRSCAPASPWPRACSISLPSARVAHIGLYREPVTLQCGRILFQDAGGLSPSGWSSSSIRCWPPATPRSPRSTG